MSDKVVLVEIPGQKRPRYRWLVGNKDGRLVARSPKVGVKIKDLSKKRNSDYGKAVLLPKGSRIWRHHSGRKSKRSKSKRKTRRRRRTSN